jgi:hypothetical protein
LHAFQRGVPHAGVVQALAGVAFLQFRQVKPGAEMFTLAIEHGGAHSRRQVFKEVAQRQDEPVRQRVALGPTGQAHHGNRAADFELNVFLGHGGVCQVGELLL